MDAVASAARVRMPVSPARAGCPQRRDLSLRSRGLRKKRDLKTGRRPRPGGVMRPRNATWHSSPGRAGDALRRLPARLVAVRTSRPATSPEAGREPHPPSTRSHQVLPRAVLVPRPCRGSFFAPPGQARRAGIAHRDAAPQQEPGGVSPGRGNIPATAHTSGCRCTHFLDTMIVQSRRVSGPIDLPCPFRLRSGWTWRCIAARRTSQRDRRSPRCIRRPSGHTDGAAGVLRQGRHRSVGTHTCGRMPTTTG